MVDVLAKNWWIILIRGIAAIVFGILALAFPHMTGIVLVILFGAYALVDGIFAVVAAIIGATRHDQRWWVLLLEGLFGMVIGLVVWTDPLISALVLLYFIAFWSIVTGLLEIFAAIQLRDMVKNEFWLILAGILSILFGIWILHNPFAGALAVLWVIGAYAILFGVLFIGLSLRLRSHARRGLPA
ncbi:MAG: HdeD family acid-resistance protein [Candidatus Baltobacteraceae bacterium]